MRVRIHRGAHEIGGNCIEVANVGDRIVLDLGRPLAASWDEEVPLPDVDGLSGGDDHLLGVVLSHPHLDHYGLARGLGEGVPIYMGADAARVLDAAAFFSPISASPPLSGALRDREAFRLGPFTITPFVVDHSAFDAYSLLIEAGGRRLFYSGDFRGHGRKRALFERLIDRPPTVDAVLMEGTNIRYGKPSEDQSSERDVEDDLVETFRSTDGLVATFSSAQNIDRLVTVFRAARRSGRILVMDLYTATIAAATGRTTIPQPGFDGVAVYVPFRQRVRVKQSSEFERVAEIKHLRVYPEDLASGRGKYAYLGVSSAAQELVASGALEGGAIVWSLWSGYLKQTSGARMMRLLEDAKVPLVMHHTSGHASLADLQRLAKAFDPARIVPIHSEATDRFGEHFDHVEQHADGEWWEV